LKQAVASCYQSASRTFGEDLAKWDEPHLRKYKERLDEAYPEGFPSTDSRYAGLRARYAQLKQLELERLRKIAILRAMLDESDDDELGPA